MRACYLPSLMYVFSWVRVGFAPNAYPGSTSEFIANSHAFYRTLKVASIMTALVVVINLQPFYSVNNKIFEEENFHDLLGSLCRESFYGKLSHNVRKAFMVSLNKNKSCFHVSNY